MQTARLPSENEDFIAVSRLKEFIETITSYPENWESELADLTHVLNTSIVEDADVVMATLVNTIVDQVKLRFFYAYE